MDRVKLEFKPGITAVVGPNGCGKSNVVDAVRWAMGEQSPRRLRGKAMEDIIFGGAEGRAPVGMAEVMLTFDNSSGTAPTQYADYSEIQVGRRLYRTGESEYSINKVPVRLRDVLDFFRDTGLGTKGYTIVEQGQIGAIIAAKPEERRLLLEEAAGISKYKARKVEAERKIQATEQNLVRVNDVLNEIRRQINSIERQARKAARYKRLREIVRTLDISLSQEDRKQLLAEIESVRNSVSGMADQASSLEIELSQKELSLEETRLAITEREQAMNQGAEALYQIRADIKTLESRIDFEKRERTSLLVSNEAREEEVSQLGGQEVAALERSKQVDSELASIEEHLASQSEQMSQVEQQAATARETLAQLEAKRTQASQAQLEVLTQVARIEDRLASLEDQRESLALRMRSTDEQLEVQQSEASETSREQDHLEEGLRNLLAERDRLMQSLRVTLERQEVTQEEVRDAQQRLLEARELREKRWARLTSLQELLAGHEDVGAGNRFLLESSADVVAGSEPRLVRDILEVPSDVEAAVAAVLAERAQALVASDYKGALDSLQRLRVEHSGRGFLVVQKDETEAVAEVVPLGSPLGERVTARPGYESLVRNLLAGVYLVDRLDEVVEIYGASRIPASFVTPNGDLLTADGLVAGGGDAPETGLLARAREVRELEHEVSELDLEQRKLEHVAQATETALNQVNDEVDNLRNRHHTSVLAVANHEKDLERTRERLKALTEVQESRVSERSNLVQETKQAELEGERLLTDLESNKAEKLEQQRTLDELGLEIGSTSREVARLDTAVAEQRVEHTARVEKRDHLLRSQNEARASLQEARTWLERRRSEIAQAQERAQTLLDAFTVAESELTSKLEEEETARLGNDERRDVYEKEAVVLRELEEVLRRLRTDVHTKREEAQRAELKVREAELRLEHLETSVRDRWQVELESWVPPTELEQVGNLDDSDTADKVESAQASSQEASDDAAESKDQRTLRETTELLDLPIEERRNELKQYQRKLDALGEVNLAAIDEHEELGERFRFLTEQKADLEETLASLREAIARINRTSRKRFREAFDAVNARFQENFPRLFRGGKASLILTESDDVLEAGVEIMAMPPGKRLQNVSLFSGGEKTLTAIAMLIALFQVRPSPFFLLDEVDAPLDDVNVSRFNEIIREMAQDSQFLLITHNKTSMTCADLLYGVTMESKGVSRIVSVDLH